MRAKSSKQRCPALCIFITLDFVFCLFSFSSVCMLNILAGILLAGLSPQTNNTLPIPSSLGVITPFHNKITYPERRHARRLKSNRLFVPTVKDLMADLDQLDIKVKTGRNISGTLNEEM